MPNKTMKFVLALSAMLVVCSAARGEKIQGTHCGFLPGIQRKPLVIAHRGGRRWAPENTLVAFRKSLAAHVDGIELDIHRCKSGELVVIHDESVDRTTDGTGLVKDNTLEELRKLDAGTKYNAEFRGEKIPLLSEVLELVDGKAIINIEIKNQPISYPGIDDQLISMLANYKYPDKIMISSFDHQILQSVGKKTQRYKLGMLDSALIADLGAYAKTVGAASWNPDVEAARGDAIKNAHDNGIEVHTWTVNDKANWERLSSQGVDAIITDDPEGLLRFEGR